VPIRGPETVRAAEGNTRSSDSNSFQHCGADLSGPRFVQPHLAVLRDPVLLLPRSDSQTTASYRRLRISWSVSIST